jgi:hypothetical protein
MRGPPPVGEGVGDARAARRGVPPATETRRRRGRGKTIILGLLALVVSLAWAPGARAQEDAHDEPASASAEAPPAATADATAAPAPKRDWTLEYGGRLFVRDTLTRVDIAGDDVWRHDRTLDQARLFATYDRKKLRVAFEVELAGGDAELKDTYIRLKPVDLVRIQAGRFKVPMSFIWLESKWSLPAVERGVLNDLEQDTRGLPFGGIRGEGVSVELRPPVPLEPRFTAAVFHNPLASSATPLDASEDVTQDLYSRLEVAPGPWLRAAASFGWIGYTTDRSLIETYEHMPMGGVELAVDTEYLRAWVEGFVGKSFFYQPDNSTSGTFAAARALVAGRLRRPVGGIWRIEPYALVSVFDPTGDQSGDRVSEVAGGTSVAFSKHWRLQLEVAQRIAEGALAPIADTTLIRLQLAAAFSEEVQ